MESTSEFLPPIPKSITDVPEKVVIFLRATGNAPVLKQNKFKVSSNQRFLSIQDFVRKQLLLQERDPLVSRANRRHFFCYSSEGMLVINYSTSAAWG